MAGYARPRHMPPVKEASHIGLPLVLKATVKRIAPSGKVIADRSRRPRESATRPPTSKPIDAGVPVIKVNAVIITAEYSRTSRK